MLDDPNKKPREARNNVANISSANIILTGVELNAENCKILTITRNSYVCCVRTERTYLVYFVQQPKFMLIFIPFIMLNKR